MARFGCRGFRVEQRPSWLVRFTQWTKRWRSERARGRVELLESQYAVLRQIAAGGALQQSLVQICLMVEKLEPGAVCTMVRLEDGKYLRSIAAPSLPHSYAGAIDGLQIGPAAGSCGTAMWRRQRVIVSDIQHDPLWREYLDIATAFDLRACWSTPVFSAAGQVLGSFAVYYRKPLLPSSRVMEAIDVAVELAAIAMERELLDNALSISRTRFELAQRIANVALWQHDFKTGRAYWSPEFRQMLDLDPDVEPSQAEAYSRVLPEDLPRLKSMHLQALQSGRPYELQIRVRWRDGSIHHVIERGRASFGADGSLLAIAGAIQDETERHDMTVKLAALAYAVQQANAHHSVDELTHLLVDNARELSGAQFACVSVSGADSAQNPVRSVASHYEVNEQQLDELMTIVQSRAVDPIPLHYARGEQSHPLLQRGLWGMPMYARDGQLLGHIVVLDKAGGDFTDLDENLLRQLVDIAAISTENVLLYGRLEARVRERTAELEQSNRELEAFSYSVSHDLRGPLRAIAGFTALIEQEHTGQLDQQLRAYLNRIRDATLRMSTLIDDLLELSRVSRGKMIHAQVDLSALAAECAKHVVERYPGREVRLQIEPNLQVAGDPRLLSVVLDNLLDNAWKFTRDQSQAEVRVGFESRNNELIYYVADNGAGFDPRYTEQLFGVFQRLHTIKEFPGTGVGLASVQRIIQRHGGRVWAEGAIGQGTKISFTLPNRAAA